MFTIVIGKSFIKMTIKLINSQIPNAILSLDSTSFRTLLATTELSSKDNFEDLELPYE